MPTTPATMMPSTTSAGWLKRRIRRRSARSALPCERRPSTGNSENASSCLPSTTSNARAQHYDFDAAPLFNKALEDLLMGNGEVSNITSAF